MHDYKLLMTNDGGGEYCDVAQRAWTESSVQTKITDYLLQQ